jgi:hypothetical protein
MLIITILHVNEEKGCGGGSETPDFRSYLNSIGVEQEASLASRLAERQPTRLPRARWSSPEE